MPNRRTLARHAGLLNRMASTVGVDLEEAMQRGALQGEELAEFVLSCAGCSDPTACESWLTSNQKVGNETPPTYCRNSSALKGLRELA